jgi:hypothetical protein
MLLYCKDQAVNPVSLNIRCLLLQDSDETRVVCLQNAQLSLMIEQVVYIRTTVL